MVESYAKHHHLLGNGYRLDLVGDPTAIVLRREVGSEVAGVGFRTFACHPLPGGRL